MEAASFLLSGRVRGEEILGAFPARLACPYRQCIFDPSDSRLLNWKFVEPAFNLEGELCAPKPAVN